MIATMSPPHVAQIVLTTAALIAALIARKRRRTIVRSFGSKADFERMLQDPTFQEQLRTRGLDPSQLAADLRSGKATFEGGKFKIRGKIKLTDGALPKSITGRGPLSAEMTKELARSPQFVAKLREAGIDPAEFERKLASGEVKVLSEGVSPEQPGWVDPLPHTLSSDDGDDVWKTGKL